MTPVKGDVELLELLRSWNLHGVLMMYNHVDLEKNVRQESSRQSHYFGAILFQKQRIIRQGYYLPLELNSAHASFIFVIITWTCAKLPCHLPS